MKKINILLVLLLTILAIPLVACSTNKKLVAVYAVTFYNSEIEMQVGQTTQLQYKVFPNNATHKEVEFYSSDPSVATVSKDGKVTLHHESSAEITVRTKDGGFTSICVISPVVEATVVSVDTTKTEQKYVSGQAVDQLLLTIGQSKALPVLLEPANASSTLLKVTANNNKVEVVYSAQWYIVGKEVGETTLTVECGEESCQFNVVVTQPIENAYIQVNNVQGNILEKVSDNKYVGNIVLELDDDEAILNLSLIDKNERNINKIGISAQIGNEEICDVNLITTFEEFNNLYPFASESEKLLFNINKYIIITPKLDGQTKLYVLCDGFAQNDKPVEIELNISVSDNVQEIVSSVNTEYRLSENVPLVYVGDRFSIDTLMYTLIAGEQRLILSDRKIYFKIGNVYSSYITPVESTNSSYFVCNQFTALARCEAAIIDVYVAKSSSTPAITELTDAQRDDQYVHTTVQLAIENKISEIHISYNGNILENNNTIVVQGSIGAEIALQVGVIATNGTLYSKAASNWTYIIESSNEAAVVVGQNGTLTINSAGTAEITVKVTDGVQTYQKTIIINTIL